MALNFPTPSAVNQVYSANGTSWIWDGASWVAYNGGATGLQGIQGVQGLQGTQGIQGLQGIQGIQGIQGVQGTQGTQGTQGLQGIQGLQGTTGLAFTIAKTYVSVAALTADTSPTSIIAGQFALINTLDVQDAENSRLYIWTGSAYTFVDDLSGTAGIQGITGSQGLTGIQGAQGLQGTQGTQGLQGIQGIQGLTGIQGAQGLQGAQGTQGEQGIQGIQGLTGIQGTQGAQGTQGLQGIQGLQGSDGTQGAIGTQGAQGTQGLQGIQGIQGVQGTQGVQGIQGTIGTAGARDYSVINSGSGAYTIDGSNNPTLNLLRGFAYTFTVSASGHPFWIQTSAGAYSSGNVYNTGVTNNGTQSGTITFSVAYNAPSTLYYVCQYHSGMAGTINISDVGPQGVQGIQGITGSQGTQGTLGAQGTQGTQGAQGTAGANNLPVNAQSTSYSLVIGDVGKYINITTGGVIVAAGVFSSGDVVSIFNNSVSNQTITQGASVTMYLAGSATTGNRTLSQYGLTTILCVASNTFVISGAGLT